MKHLLIILTILLISSPVIGDKHQGETLYLWTTSSGLVWKRFGEKGTNPKYQGHVENGKPSGIGVLTFPDRSKMVKEYLLFLGVESMKVNTRMGTKMVKEQKPTLVEVSM